MRISIMKITKKFKTFSSVLEFNLINYFVLELSFIVITYFI